MHRASMTRTGANLQTQTASQMPATGLNRFHPVRSSYHLDATRTRIAQMRVYDTPGFAPWKRPAPVGPPQRTPTDPKSRRPLRR